RLRAGQLAEQLALGERQGALGYPAGEVVPQAGEGVVAQQRPEGFRRLSLDLRAHQWNIPARPMVYSVSEWFNDLDNHWRRNHGCTSLPDRPRRGPAQHRG